MKKLEVVNPVWDSDYAYINTFIELIKKLLDYMNEAFGDFIANLAALFAVLPAGDGE